MASIPSNIIDHVRRLGGIIVDDCPDREYHASLGVSNSDLKAFARSPAHYQHAKAHPKQDTPVMALGTLVHCLVLEQATLAERFHIAEKFDKRTKSGKESAAIQERLADGKTLVDAETFEAALSMAEAVAAHPTASLLFTGGKAERSAFWLDEETGLLCRCRADYHKPGMLVDLKTTSDASPVAFARQVANFRYHVQDAFYTAGFSSVGEEINHFAFVVVETEAPYGVAVYCLDDAAAIEGGRLARRDLNAFAICTDKNEWSAYPEHVQSLPLPRWAFPKHDGNDEEPEQ